MNKSRRTPVMMHLSKYTATIKGLTALLCIVSAPALFLFPAPAQTSGVEKIKWHAYKEGMALGRDLKKKVVISFEADWCTYCRKMDRETFNDRVVAEYLNNNFIAVKVDSERETEIASLFNVTGLPSTWFVAETGEKISNLPGFVPPDLFISILMYIDTDSYRDMSLKKFLKSL